MEIIKGKIPGAKKIVVYGPEGIGKSTFAAQFPDPLFIDTEGSTKDMEVARTPAPSSWTLLVDQTEYVREHPDVCRTLVIDTADWAEILCSNFICSKSQKSGIEEFGYGKGYIYLQEEFGRLLNRLTEVIEKGIHVILTAHAKMRKFEQPDEQGAYDRWEMKLSKGVAPMVKEWADMVLFANYKTFVVNVDGQGVSKGKNKAQGGKRVMYTTHHPCWDAKNRYGLPEEMDFKYADIAHILNDTGRKPEAGGTGNLKDKEKPVIQETNAQQMELTLAQEKPLVEQEVPPALSSFDSVPEQIPKALRDLMKENGVGEWDIQAVVSDRGYYPSDTPIANYDPDFITGVLIGAWPQVFQMIQEMKKNETIPF